MNWKDPVNRIMKPHFSLSINMADVDYFKERYIS